MKKIEDIKIVKKNNNIKLNKIILEDSFADNSIKKEKNFFLKKKTISNNFNKKRKISWVFILLFFLVSFLACNYFEYTKINIENRKEENTLNSRKFQASNISDTDINYEIMIIDGEDEKSLTLTDTKNASIKSSGSLIIYNEYSSYSQKIIAGSYLTDEGGKLYTLDETITIPGFTTDKDGNIIPGSINTSATSFLPGDIYNGNPTYFVFNSFKNTNKENKIYAKSESTFSGGISGDVYYLNEDNIVNLNSYANNAFKSYLIKKAKAELPSGYIFYENAIDFKYEIDTNLLFKESISKIPIKGSITAIIFNEDSLSKKIINEFYPKIETKEINEIQLENINNLSFSFVNKEETITKNLNSFEFYLSGKINFIWNPNKDLVLSQLLGIHKDWAQDVFKKDPGIKSASVIIFPPWKNNLPDDVSRINIIIN